jgi:hypothetical protein
MGEPLSTAVIFAFLNSCFRFAEYAVKLYGVESENGIFVNLIQQVQHDLEETERLLSIPDITKKIKNTPDKWCWIQKSIAAAKASLIEIGKCVEPVRGEQEAYGSATFKTKVKWIFKDHDKLVTRSRHLNSVHLSLQTVLGFLTPLEDSIPQSPARATDELPTYAEATYLSPWRRLRRAQQQERYHRGDEAKDEGALSSQSCGFLTDRPSSQILRTSQRLHNTTCARHHP